MDRQQIRLKRVRDLVTEEGGLARFAERLGMSNSQVSQFAGKNPTRNIGNSVAAKIEAAYGKPAGWLDATTAEAQPSDGVDLVARDAEGHLYVLQMKESQRILGELDDANLSTALGYLQALLKQQRTTEHSATPKPEHDSPDPEYKFVVGRPLPGPRRHGTK